MENDGYIAFALKDARKLAKRSQEYMSLEMGIARKTVQNWEKGISEPTIEQAVTWFQILDISPLPYLFQYIYRDMEGISSKDSDIKLKKSLDLLLRDLPSEGVRQLLYLFYGDHGSAPRAVLNMVTAHLQTSLKDRITTSTMILKNYELTEKTNRITSPEHIKPNVEVLKRAIANAEKTVVNDGRAYMCSKVDSEENS